MAPKDYDIDQDLKDGLLARDPAARAFAFEKFHPLLLKQAGSLALPLQDREDLSSEALVFLIEEPERFFKGFSNNDVIRSWLLKRLQGDVRDLLRKRKRAAEHLRILQHAKAKEHTGAEAMDEIAHWELLCADAARHLGGLSLGTLLLDARLEALKDNPSAAPLRELFHGVEKSLPYSKDLAQQPVTNSGLTVGQAWSDLKRILIRMSPAKITDDPLEMALGLRASSFSRRRKRYREELMRARSSRPLPGGVS